MTLLSFPTLMPSFLRRHLQSLRVNHHMNPLSVILHLDLDCFYAQVERERLGLPKDAEVAVVQWTMALAVSYPARKYGIKRGTTVDDIRRLSNNAVTIVHVDTISAAPPKTSATPAAAVAMERTLDATQARARTTEKVSLARYRSASARVFAAIDEAVRGMADATVERASIDEAFIDVTAEVDRRLSLVSSVSGADITMLSTALPDHTHVIGGALDAQSTSDVRLAIGAHIAADVRAAVMRCCAYSMSGGISVNKLLAKFASARHKPTQQTVVPIAAVPQLMHDVPLARLRGLGGKLGRDVQALGVHTAGEAVALSMSRLEQTLHSTKAARFVFQSVRGIDESMVAARNVTKSLLAAKSFEPQRSLTIVEGQWIPLLAEELAYRLEEDAQLNDRAASTLSVSFRAAAAHNAKLPPVSACRSTAMPVGTAHGHKDAIAEVAKNLIRNVMYKDVQFAFPISFIGLTACNFSQRVDEKERISSFFGTKGASEDAGVVMGVASSSGDAGHDHERRLQEKADRELALRLHRQESSSSKGVRKPAKKVAPKQGKRKSKATAKQPKGVLSVPSFFKPK